MQIRSRFVFHLVVFIALLASMLGSVGSVTPVKADLPTGFTTADWKQIQALLPPTQQAYLKASNTEASDQFGQAIAISGDTLVVGASNEDSNAIGVNGNGGDNSASNSGAAYVFTRSGGVWSQQAYLKASNTEAGDEFGLSVAISGDTIVVGARSEDSNATGVNGDGTNNSATSSGAAYVFIRNGGVWSQQAYLKASNTGVGDYFGFSVAISGDTVIAGAMLEDSNATGVNGNEADNSAANSGAAYVFTRSGTTWTQQAYLKASNTGGNDEFGYSVAISGDTIVAGAFGEDSNAGGVNGNQADNSSSSSGAAYVFTRSSGVWSQQAYLKASNTEADDWFGRSADISGDTIVMGVYREDSNATGVNNGNQVDNSAPDSGAAYVFTRSGTTWIQQAYLKASNTAAGDGFGLDAAISGDTIVVGASSEDSNATGVNGNQADNSASASGAAYVFTRNGGVWSQQVYLKASNTEANDFFIGAAISGDMIVAGAVGEDSNATGVNGDGTDNSATASGAAYVFVIPHTVTFNANGGYGSMSDLIASSAAALTNNTFTRPGHSFSGWNTAANGSGTAYANGASYSFSADITLYAQWTVSPTFVDVPVDYWSWRFIESIYSAGITGGCSTTPLNYCPTQAVTRAQMAVFLLRGIHGSSFTPPSVNGSTGFNDVAVDHWAAAWIKQLAAEGITGGCGNGNYCPEDTVTRDQMAVFLLKAKYGSSYAPPAVGASTGFNDVPVDYWAAVWIKQLAAEAITGGCGGGLYCPSNPVTRDQMAVFLQRTFNLPLP